MMGIYPTMDIQLNGDLQCIKNGKITTFILVTITWEKGTVEDDDDDDESNEAEGELKTKTSNNK